MVRPAERGGLRYAQPPSDANTGITNRMAEPEIGPHEGRELELLLAGQKPLAMFTDVPAIETGFFPEDDFASHVAAGRLVMRVAFEPLPPSPQHGNDLRLRRVLYATPHEAWRMEAMLLVCHVAAQLGIWDEGLERMTGKLLGYTEQQIDAFVARAASLPK